MSAPVPVQSDDRLNDARLYAPPWARERPLPAAAQPRSISSPPVASEPEMPLPGAAPEDRQPTWAPRMPKGVGGPNLDCPPEFLRPEFGGDIAMRALRRRLALEADIVPQPPVMLARDPGLPWMSRLGFVFMAAGIAGFGIAFMATTESQRLAGAGHSRAVVESSGKTAPAGRGQPARLVVEDGKISSNEPLPLGVSLQGASGGEFVMLAGLAPGTRFTAGAPVGSKGWRVMARDLGSVLAHAPRDYVGAMDAAIDLRSPGDTLLDSQVVRLEWVSKTPYSPNVATPLIPAARPGLRRLEPDEIARLVQRGRQLLQTGDIASARLALRRAAEASNAEAALALGTTFDPATLRDIGVLGFASNAGQARQWYQKAAELGSIEASRRLDRLQE
jgi:hypothetical protein